MWGAILFLQYIRSHTTRYSDLILLSIYTLVYIEGDFSSLDIKHKVKNRL